MKKLTFFFPMMIFCICEVISAQTTTIYKLYDNSAGVTYKWKFDKHVQGVKFCTSVNGVATTVSDSTTKVAMFEYAAAAAFSFWSNYTDINFQQADDNEQADITIALSGGNSYSFGSATYGQGGASIQLYCDMRAWTNDTILVGRSVPENVTYLRYGLAHEIGHCIVQSGTWLDGSVMQETWDTKKLIMTTTLKTLIKERYYCKVYVESSIGQQVKIGSTWYCSGGYAYLKHNTAYNFQVSNNVYISPYVRLFKLWQKEGVNTDQTSTTASFTMPSPPANTPLVTATYRAEFLKRYDISIAIPSVTSVVINDTTRSGTTVIYIKEDSSLTVTAPSLYSYNSIQYSSNGWTSGGTTYSPSFTITPSDNMTFAWVEATAVKPVNTYRNMQYSSTVGSPITVSWSEHPNTGVTAYQVWRRIKDVQDATLLTTVSRGTTSYIDNECTYTSGYSDNLIYYDVRAYYSPNGSCADADYEAIFGDYTAGDGDASVASSSDNSTKAAPTSLSALPTEYTMANYPNPFNPATVIKYTMPEAGQIILKVYNMIGQEVRTLVDGMQSAGVHTVNFNANGLPTGIYIARIQAGAKVMSLKLQLVK